MSMCKTEGPEKLKAPLMSMCKTEGPEKLKLHWCVKVNVLILSVAY